MCYRRPVPEHPWPPLLQMWKLSSRHDRQRNQLSRPRRGQFTLLRFKLKNKFKIWLLTTRLIYPIILVTGQVMVPKDLFLRVWVLLEYSSRTEESLKGHFPYSLSKSYSDLSSMVGLPSARGASRVAMSTDHFKMVFGWASDVLLLRDNK